MPRFQPPPRRAGPPYGLPAQATTQGGQFWTPIGGQYSTPVDRVSTETSEVGSFDGIRAPPLAKPQAFLAHQRDQRACSRISGVRPAMIRQSAWTA